MNIRDELLKEKEACSKNEFTYSYIQRKNDKSEGYRTEENPIVKGCTSMITTAVGGVIGKGIEIPLNNKINPNWKNYTEMKGHLPYEISEPYKPSIIPSLYENTIDNISSKSVENKVENEIDSYYKGRNDEK